MKLVKQSVIKSITNKQKILGISILIRHHTHGADIQLNFLRVHRLHLEESIISFFLYKKGADKVMNAYN